MSSLPIYFENRLVGRIEVTPTGPTFAYAAEWLSLRGAFPISTRIPLTTTLAPAQAFLPWAANLLPESGVLRTLGQLRGIAPEDVVSLLAEIGRDTAGALSIGAPGAAPPTDDARYRPIESEAELARILDELPNKPFLAGEEGVSMSLAGVQTKIGLHQLSDARLAVPIEGAPSTWILKPDSGRFPGMVQNEAFCLTLARLCGLSAPAVSTGRAGGRTYLLVKRYDRLEQRGRWRRLHQEDFCQALGKPPEAKYESNQSGVRGPGAADMVALARNLMRPSDVVALVDALAFNIAACNTDAHAKNYSLMLPASGPTLAPLYDIVCTRVWDGITQNLAQKIGGQNRGDHVARRHWSRFAAQAGLNPARTHARVRQLAGAVANKIAAARAEVAAMPAGDHPILDAVEARVRERAQRLVTGLDEDRAEG